MIRCADQREDTGLDTGQSHLRQGVKRHRAMFQIQKQPVITGIPHDRSPIHRPGQPQADTKTGLSVFKTLTKGEIHGNQSCLQFNTTCPSLTISSIRGEAQHAG